MTPYSEDERRAALVGIKRRFPALTGIRGMASAISDLQCDLTRKDAELGRAKDLLRESMEAMRVLCDTMAYAPSTVPGAIEDGLKSAYDKQRIAGAAVYAFLAPPVEGR